MERFRSSAECSGGLQASERVFSLDIKVIFYSAAGPILCLYPKALRKHNLVCIFGRIVVSNQSCAADETTQYLR